MPWLIAEAGEHLHLMALVGLIRARRGAHAEAAPVAGIGFLHMGQRDR